MRCSSVVNPSGLVAAEAISAAAARQSTVAIAAYADDLTGGTVPKN
jgi:hypothetical protein